MSSEHLLKPLHDVAYLCECAAQDYTGELKSELSALCEDRPLLHPRFP